MILRRRRRHFDRLAELPLEAPPRLVSRWPHRPAEPARDLFDWEVECPTLVGSSECHVHVIEDRDAVVR